VFGGVRGGGGCVVDFQPKGTQGWNGGRGGPRTDRCGGVEAVGRKLSFMVFFLVLRQRIVKNLREVRI